MQLCSTSFRRTHFALLVIPSHCDLPRQLPCCNWAPCRMPALA